MPNVRIYYTNSLPQIVHTEPNFIDNRHKVHFFKIQLGDVELPRISHMLKNW